MKLIQHAALSLGLAAFASACAAAPVNITIDAGKPGPVINKNIYGQFAEHLGAGIYGGMWVGPQSAIPNVRGWRKDVVGALKDLHVPVVRWPGGCFADEYHWRDGIGTRARRPVKVNTNWGGVAEDNAVGTHEFFDLVEQIGTDAYISGNLGSGSVQEMSEWVEYLTADGKSSLAQLRARNGHAKPFKVAFFGVGNESWGCGGNMTPPQYLGQYNQYTSFLKSPNGNTPKFIASGGNDSDTSWTDVLSANQRLRDHANGISFHYYTIPTGVWETKGAATGFGEDQWMSTLQKTLGIERMIADNVAKLDKNDPKRKLSFVVDEWGTWYDATPGSNPGFLEQQNSLRDAVVAALNFNIFHAHADRVSMTNIAQMVNVLQAMILTDKDKMVLTPTYHAFKMYVPFQDATALPVTLADNPKYVLGQASIAAVSATAARAKDGKLYLALVNTNPQQAIEVALGVAGAKASAATGSVLTASAMDAHNTFAAPKAVMPKPFKADLKDGKLVATLPAKSVVVLAIGE